MLLSYKNAQRQRKTDRVKPMTGKHQQGRQSTIKEHGTLSSSSAAGNLSCFKPTNLPVRDC